MGWSDDILPSINRSIDRTPEPTNPIHPQAAWASRDYAHAGLELIFPRSGQRRELGEDGLVTFCRGKRQDDKRRAMGWAGLLCLWARLSLNRMG